MFYQSCSVMTLSAIFSLVILVSACGGGGGSSTGQSPQAESSTAEQRKISTEQMVYTVLPSVEDNQIYTPYEIMTIHVPYMQPYFKVDVRINGQVVDYSIEDQQLYVRLPALDAGQYRLQIKIDDQVISHAFQIDKTHLAITDIDQYLGEYIDGLYAQISEPETNASVEDEAQRQEWLMQFSRLELAIEEMSLAQKQILARTIQANPLHPINSEAKAQRLSAFSSECSSLIWTRDNIVPGLAAATAGIGTLLVKRGDPTGIALLVGGGIVLHKYRHKIVNLMNNLIENCTIGHTFRAFEQDFEAVSSSSRLSNKVSTEEMTAFDGIDLSGISDLSLKSVQFTHNVADFRHVKLKSKLSDEVPNTLIMSFRSILTGMQKVQALLSTDYYSSLPKKIRQFDRYMDLDLNQHDFSVTSSHQNIVAEVVQSENGLSFKFTYTENNKALKPTQTPIPFQFIIVDHKENRKFGPIDAELHVKLPIAYSQTFQISNFQTLNSTVDAENFSSLKLLDSPKHGRLTLYLQTGEFIYKPNGYEVIEDKFIISAKNDLGESKAAIVTIQVNSDCRIQDTRPNQNAYSMNCYWPNTNILRSTESLTISPLSFEYAEKLTAQSDLNSQLGSRQTKQATQDSLRTQSFKDTTLRSSYIFDESVLEDIYFDAKGSMTQSSCFYGSGEHRRLNVYRPVGKPERIIETTGEGLCGNISSALVGESTIKNSKLYRWAVENGYIH